jgi:hypothetical protein
MNFMEEVYIGFDISTTCIGLSFFNQKGELINLSHIKLETEKEIDPNNRYIHKANIFKEYLQGLKKYNIKAIFIEEPLLGSNNIFTVGILLRFNGICSYLISQELNINPEFITIHEARKIFCPEFLIKKGNKEVFSFPKALDKKEYIWKKASVKYPFVEWLYNKKGKLMKENFDMSDSIVIAEAGLKLKGIL